MTSNTGSHLATGTLFESVRLKAELDPGARAHLEECDLCQGRKRWMEAATRLGPNEVKYDPPQAVMDKVLRMGRNNGLDRLRKFILASLSFDSFSALAPAGVRRAETTERHMTFEAGDLEISLSFRQSDQRNFVLTGQVAGKGGEPVPDVSGRVALVIEGEHVATTDLSAWGEFMFQDVPGGSYALQFALSDRLLRIRSLLIAH
jgi:hypothetical protein